MLLNELYIKQFGIEAAQEYRSEDKIKLGKHD